MQREGKVLDVKQSLYKKRREGEKGGRPHIDRSEKKGERLICARLKKGRYMRLREERKEKTVLQFERGADRVFVTKRRAPLLHPQTGRGEKGRSISV